MPRNFWLATAALAAAIAGLAWLTLNAPPPPEDRAMVLPVDPEPLIVETEGRYRAFPIEIADKPWERQRGLMFRESLPEDHGMLFVFETPRTLSLWMKYTPIALDVIFISEDGRVKAVMRGEPFSDEAMTTVSAAKYVLEFKAGTAARNNIVDWARMSHRVMPLARKLPKPS